MLMAQTVQPPQGDDPKPRLDPVEGEKQSWVKGSSSDTTLSATVDAKSQIADQLSLHAALTSRTLVRIGPATNDEVAELIESMSDHRDRCLPRRGDPPSFATDTRSGRRSLYVNEGYRCSGDNVRGGILDLMPLRVLKSFIANGNMSRPACLTICDKVQREWHHGHYHVSKLTFGIALCGPQDRRTSTSTTGRSSTQSSSVTKEGGCSWLI